LLKKFVLVEVHLTMSAKVQGIHIILRPKLLR